MTEIKTARLVLKKLSPADKGRLVNLIGNYEVAKNLSRVPHPYTLADAEDWMARRDINPLNLSIFLDGNLIGGVGLEQDEKDGAWALGYWLGEDYWGQGYGTEAARALIEHAQSTLQQPTIKARVHKGNASSIKVLNKLGFTIVGEGTDFSEAQQVHVEYFEMQLNE